MPPPTHIPNRRTASIAGGLLLAALVGAALSKHDPQPTASDEVPADLKAASPTTARSAASTHSASGAAAPAATDRAAGRNGHSRQALRDDSDVKLPAHSAEPGNVDTPGRDDGEPDWPLAEANPDIELVDAQDLDEFDRQLAEDAEFVDEYFDSDDDWDADEEDLMLGYTDDWEVDPGPAVPLNDGSADQLPTGFASKEILAGYDDASTDAVPLDSNLGANAAPTEALVSALVDDDLSLEVDPVELAAQAEFEGQPTPQGDALPPEVPAGSDPPTD